MVIVLSQEENIYKILTITMREAAAFAPRRAVVELDRLVSVGRHDVVLESLCHGRH